MFLPYYVMFIINIIGFLLNIPILFNIQDLVFNSVKQ